MSIKLIVLASTLAIVLATSPVIGFDCINMDELHDSLLQDIYGNPVVLKNGRHHPTRTRLEGCIKRVGDVAGGSEVIVKRSTIVGRLDIKEIPGTSYVLFYDPAKGRMVRRPEVKANPKREPDRTIIRRKRGEFYIDEEIEIYSK